MTDGALKTRGIHHITAFAGSAQANLDFYAGVLGLRLVKKTVNFDAPHVYHFYYGDERGTPGTVMTFFPFEDGRQGRVGGGQVGRIRFAAPPGSLPFWEDRLSRYGVEHERIRRFGGEAIRFRDHEGLQLELEEQAAGKPIRWSFAGIPADKAVKGFAGALLYSIAPARTMQLLERLFGFVRIGEEGGVVRFRTNDGPGDGLGDSVDVYASPVGYGRGGLGTAHHIAMRAADKDEQERWRKRVLEAGFDPTPIVDRNYFTSIYFRDAGGILFEIATDGPGFERDEPFDRLGSALMLPPWYEPHRSTIERLLSEAGVREPVPPGERADE